VQLAGWGERVPVEQIDTVLDHGSRPPSTGIMIFAWHGLRDDAAKQQATGRYFRRNLVS